MATLEAPDGVAHLGASLAQLTADHLAPWVHAAVQLADAAERSALLDRAADRFTAEPDALALVQRGRAVCALLDGAPAEADAALDLVTTARPHHEAWVYAVAAERAASQGRLAEADGWLGKSTKLSFALPDASRVLESIEQAAFTVAERLLAGDLADPLAERLVRSASALARMTAERHGTWRDVERAERVLAEVSLRFTEPVAAAAHAEIASAMCRMRRGTEEEVTRAATLLGRARELLHPS